MRFFKCHETHGWRIHGGKLQKCRKWPHTNLIILEPKVSLLGNQNEENLTLSDVLWTPNAENYLFSRLRKKGFFKLPKCQKLDHEKLRTIYSWISRIIKNRSFREPNCRKLAHTNLGTLEPCVPRLGWKSIFGPPKCRKWSHKKLGKLEWYDKRPGRNSIWRTLNSED